MRPLTNLLAPACKTHPEALVPGTRGSHTPARTPEANRRENKNQKLRAARQLNKITEDSEPESFGRIVGVRLIIYQK